MTTDIEKDVRATLRSWAEGVDVHPTGDEAVMRRVRVRRRRRTALVSVVTAAALAGTAAVVWVQRSGSSHVVSRPPDVPTPVPSVILDLPGWRLSYVTDVTQPAAGPVAVASPASTTAAFRDPARQFDGPMLSVTVQRSVAPPDPPSADVVDVNGLTASRVVDGSGVDMRWSTGTFEVNVSAQRLSPDEVLAFARGLQIDAATLAVTATALPPGVVAAGDPVAVGTVESHYREQQYTNGTRRFQIDFYDGGTAGFESRVAGDARRNVTVRGTTGALLDYGGGRYRLDWREGWWTWEVDSEPNADLEEFMALVRSLRVVDDATWRAAIPAGSAVFPDGRAAAIDQMLAGMTVPGGFDRSPYETASGTEWRDAVLSEVATGVACAWASEYWAAQTAGDAAASASARAALDGAPQWPAVRGHGDAVRAVDEVLAGLDHPGQSRCGPPATGHP